MKLLIDTHIFLWLAQEPNSLKPEMLAPLLDSSNQLHLSLVSLWEIQIKLAVGKLALPTSVHQFFLAQRRLLALQTVPIAQRHIWALSTLPLHHRDPFDRLLIAQAISEDLILVSADSAFHPYGVRLLGYSAQP